MNIDQIESKSWICNFLKKKGIINQQQFVEFGRFGIWVSENHPIMIKAYWSYLDKLLQKYDKIETNKNINNLFQAWTNKTLSFIRTSQNSRALDSFCTIIVFLTEKYNKDYLMFTKDELDVYLNMKKTIENSKVFYN